MTWKMRGGEMEILGHESHGDEGVDFDKNIIMRLDNLTFPSLRYSKNREEITKSIRVQQCNQNWQPNWQH